MKRLRRTRLGGLLIESLLAIFLVGMTALILASTMPIATKTRVKADNMNKAAGIAQKMVEAIRGSGYANISATQLYSLGLIDSTTPVTTATYSFTNVDTGSFDNVGRILPSGTGTVTIEQVDLDLRRITVIVNWSDRGSTRTYRLGTLVANL